jgi:hypothetical protein
MRDQGPRRQAPVLRTKEDLSDDPDHRDTRARVPGPIPPRTRRPSRHSQLGSQRFTTGIYRITRTYYRIEWKPAVADDQAPRDARGAGAFSGVFSLGRGGVSFLATSGDGAILAAGSSDTPEISIWRLAPLGKPITVRGKWQAVLSQDGSRLATLPNEQTVAIYDL